MAHKAQIKFCLEVKEMFPHCFKNKRVLDVGSLDINGNNRYLFEDCDYTGLDLKEGSNVDIICSAHAYEKPYEFFDTIISTEAFEHDKNLVGTLSNIIRMLKSGGFLIFTCASEGREEHGTVNNCPEDSPFTTDFYRPLTVQFISNILDEYIFEKSCLCEETKHHDLRFWGIKKRKGV